MYLLHKLVLYVSLIASPGLSETVELSEALPAAAQRAVQEASRPGRPVSVGDVQ